MRAAFVILMLLTIGARAAAARTFVTELRCEYRTNPVGMDVLHPRLSWVIESSRRGEMQTAYRVLVATSAATLEQGRGDLWDSGKVTSGQSCQVEYAGIPLRSRMRCWWKAQVWDRDGKRAGWSRPASWTMGLLSPSDWSGKWIGLNSSAGPASLAFDGAMWIWYAPDGLNAPVATRSFRAILNIPAGAEVESAVALFTADDQFDMSINGRAACHSDGRTDAWQRPVSADVHALVHAGPNEVLIHASNALPGSAGLIGKVAVTLAGGGSVILVTDKAWQSSSGGAGSAWLPAEAVGPYGCEPWGRVGAEKSGPLPTPGYFRREFNISGPIRRATAYVTALGLYELRMNGKRVGDHILAPEWTSYHKRIQYQTYDVTGLARRGANCVGALLGNGWYCGLWQDWPPRTGIWGDRPYLLIQIEIELADGRRQTIVSNGNWHVTTDGPLRFSGIYEGETYDARREMPGWDEVGFQEKGWKPASVGAPNAGKLVWQRSEPIRITREIRPISVKEPKPGVYVFDFGQNMAGWCRLKVHAPAGTTLTLKHNEMLNPDGTVYMDNLHAGHLSTGDRQIVRYTCRGGGEEVFEPHFTYMGFRYVEVTGLPSRPGLDLLTGCVFHTSFKNTGTFTCSNPLLNRLALNIQWSQRANMMGIPTDCPQRDERCGYTGDAEFFMPTAIYNFDEAAFFNKWLVDVCQDSQRADGGFADHAPDYGAGGSQNVGWSDAGVICPYIMYRTYGDTRVIRDNYAAMKRFLQMLVDTSHGDTRGPDHVGNGDWLNLGGGADAAVIGTAFYAYDFRIMAEMARAIGEPGDAAQFSERADRIDAAFVKTFVGPDGSIKNSSQTGYALAFTMGLAPANLRQQMADRFVDEVKRFDWHLATGFIGTPRLLPGLHDAGRDDVAYRLLLQTTYPSWLYPVTLGASTIWERWNGWTPEHGFADSGMNSFNHYSLGAVGQYLYGEVGGIQEDEPGFKHVRIQPIVPAAGLTWASASYQSIHGLIVSSWRLDGDRLSLDVAIPANTAATIYVPARDAASVMESGRPASKATGVRFVRSEGAAAVYEVGSGTYHFTSRR